MPFKNNAAQLPNAKKPCKDCPFRKDSLQGWLGERRTREILDAESFVCHKNKRLQCAGHMLMRGEKNDFVARAHRLRLDTRLRGADLVFESEQACIDHHAQMRLTLYSELGTDA